MKIAVVSSGVQEAEFLTRPIAEDMDVCFIAQPQDIPEDADIVFDLLFEHTATRIDTLKKNLPRPVFINSVIETLSATGHPFIRINAWPTFLKRDTVEVAALPDQGKNVQNIFEQLRWRYQLVPDMIGMVSARLISMMINEAYITLDQKVSTKEEIDIAMKLGSNYPYGPFEWSKLIGLANIHALLVQLSKEEQLFEVSKLLTNDAIVK